MAQEIVTWCDKHLSNDERVSAEQFAIVINGSEYKIDLCPDCSKEFVAPLVDLIGAVGVVKARRTTSKVAPAQPLIGTALPRPCLLCDFIGRDADDIKTHSSSAHSKSPTDIYGLDCPLCPRDFETAHALGMHAVRSHDSNTQAMFALALTAGDPQGVVAKRREVARA